MLFRCSPPCKNRALDRALWCSPPCKNRALDRAIWCSPPCKNRALACESCYRQWARHNLYNSLEIQTVILCKSIIIFSRFYIWAFILAKGDPIISHPWRASIHNFVPATVGDSQRVTTKRFAQVVAMAEAKTDDGWHRLM